MLKRYFCNVLLGVILVASQSYAGDNKDSQMKDNVNFNLLTTKSIFKPLLADPKWPRFTLSYQYHNHGQFGKQIFAPNFGAALPMFKTTNENATIYEVGLHAGLFASMDIDSKPSRLINSDYFVGPTLSIAKDSWDYLFRIAHTSSHLGDEFLLSSQGKRIKRVNLSYETINWTVAYNFASGFRPYVGIGYIYNAEPKNYRSAEYIMGFDYRPDYYLVDGYMKPIFGVFSKTSRHHKWHPNFSAKGGVEIQDKVFMGKAFQLLLEYYQGHSMHGQFYRDKEKYVGISGNINF